MGVEGAFGWVVSIKFSEKGVDELGFCILDAVLLLEETIRFYCMGILGFCVLFIRNK